MYFMSLILPQEVYYENVKLNNRTLDYRPKNRFFTNLIVFILSGSKVNYPFVVGL